MKSTTSVTKIVYANSYSGQFPCIPEPPPIPTGRRRRRRRRTKDTQYNQGLKAAALAADKIMMNANMQELSSHQGICHTIYRVFNQQDVYFAESYLLTPWMKLLNFFLLNSLGWYIYCHVVSFKFSYTKSRSQCTKFA